MDKKHAWDAQQYEQNSDPQHQLAREIVDLLDLKGDEHILDIGCGDGRVTRYIASIVPRGRVVGVDPSDEMLALAQQNFAAVPNLSFVQARAEDIDFDNEFDVVTSFSALHYARDHAKVLQNIFNALKPSGHFVACMDGGEAPEVSAVFDREPWKTYFQAHPPRWSALDQDVYEQLLGDSEFEVVSLKTEWMEHDFPSIDDIFNWVYAWVPFVTGLSGDQAKEFSKQVAESVAQGKTSGIILRSPLLFVEAHKAVCKR